MRIVTVLAAAVCLFSQSAATAQTSAPPPLDPYLVVMQDALRFDADDVRIAAQVSRGDAIISMGVTHTRTGVLQNDLRRNLALISVLPAGVPGYYAGQYAPIGGPAGDMWCFALSARNIEAGTKCILQTSRGWWEAGEPTNPYLPISAQVNPAAPPVPDPIIDERPIDVHSDLRAEYIFRSWGSSHVDVQLRLGGRPILAVGAFKRVQTEADGSALLNTPVGLIRLERDGRSRSRSLVSLVTPVSP